MSNARYKTHRGKEFNMAAFVEKNGDTRAVSNVSMNARGDIIDAKGNVKIPSQTISRATANLKNNESKQVSLKADESIASGETVTPADFAEAQAKPEIVETRTTEAGTEVEFSDGSIEVIPNKE